MPATESSQDGDYLRRALREARDEIVALTAERDGLLAALQQTGAPVIPVRDDVVVMPLVGDTRAQRAHAEAQVLRQAKEQARAVDDALLTVAEDAEELAAYAIELFASAQGLARGGAWDARQAMFRLTQGQLVNGSTDTMSFFVPSWVKVDDALLDELNVVSAMGPMLKAKALRNPHAIFVYVFAERGRYMGGCPNGDPNPEHPGGILADELPPDFGLTGDPVFWTLADVEANPNRGARWTSAYLDNAGQGLMISVIAPIYERSAAAPRAMIGIDVGLDSVREVIESAARGAQQGAVLIDERGHLIVANELAHERLELRRPEVKTRGAELGIALSDAARLPESVVEAMRRGETGALPLSDGSGDLVFAYAPVVTVGWSLGVVTATSGLRRAPGASIVERLMAGILRHQARVAILDATGISSIDEGTVQRIVDAALAARLLGTDVLIAGISPAVAQAILAIGVDLRQLRTYIDLRSALRAAGPTRG